MGAQTTIAIIIPMMDRPVVPAPAPRTCSKKYRKLKQEGVHRQILKTDYGTGGGEASLPEHTQVEYGFSHSLLPESENSQEQCPGQSDRRLKRRHDLQRDNQQRQAETEKNAAEHIKSRSFLSFSRQHAPRAGSRKAYQDERDQDHGQVGDENGAPAKLRGQLSTDERTDRRRRAHDRAEITKRPRPAFGGHPVPQQSHGSGNGERTSEGHAHACEGEARQVCQCETDDRSAAIDRHAQDQPLFMPDPVAELAARTHEEDPDDEITRDKPLSQRAAADIEFLPDGRQRDGNHRRTEGR